ncbi:MAG: trypsin-like peptidase domain-containing protein [Planctomycetota bacterium]
MGSRDLGLETLGVLVDPSGLVAVSRLALNPMGEEVNKVEAGPGQEIDIVSKLASVAVILADGTRVEAAVVFTDPQRDVSFVRTREPLEGRVNPVSLAEASSTMPGLLDEVLVLGRTGATTAGASSITLERISAMLETPWDCLQVNAPGGSAIYDKGGRFVGLAVHVFAGQSEDGSGGLMAAMMGLHDAGRRNRRLARGAAVCSSTRRGR